MISLDYAMINWIKNRLFKKAAANEDEETLDEVEENVAPVGVRVKPAVAVRLKPADTYVPGYNVDDGGISVDDEHSTAVNDIKTTGVDPYNTGSFDPSDTEKSVSKK